MHYVFKSKADADLLMMAAAAEQLLGLVGKAPAAQGIIEARDIPAAMQALEDAVSADDASHRTDPAFEEEGRAERVGLRQRAWPMLEMMKRSVAEKADIVWGV